MVRPCIIREILFPPTAPKEIANLIESSLVYQNNANYDMAIHTFEQARTEWKTELNAAHLRPEFELFFDLSIGSVYESCGKDEMALN
jgi:hypothetical protein